ncbi:MAG: PIN domain-containing protein [Acidimicrobiia bacterium]
MPKTSVSTTEGTSDVARPVAVLDADVLVPILSCDLLLTAFDHDLYQPIVTPKILDEVERNLLLAFPQLDVDALRRRVDQMRRALTLYTHDDTDGSDAVDDINRKDRHVVSAALIHGADVVVSNERRLRREIQALGRTLRAVSADAFAVGLLNEDRDAVEQVIEDLVAKRIRRPVTLDEFLGRLLDSFPALVTALDPDR